MAEPRKRPKRSTHLPRGISLDGEGRYRVRVTFDGRQYECGRYDSLNQAKAANDHFRIEAVKGTFVSPAQRRKNRKEQQQNGVTVRDYATLWLKELERGPRLAGKRPKPRARSTLITYQGTLNRHVLPRLGDMNLTDVTQEDVDELLDDVYLNVGPGATRSTAILLRAMFNRAVAVKAGGLEAMPFSVEIEDPEDVTAKEIPTPAEVVRISDKMPANLQLGPLLSAVCALRLGELLGLQRDDFKNLASEIPTVEISRQWNQKTRPPSYSDPKVGSKRDVVLPKFIVPLIEAHLAEHVAPGADAPLFPSATNPSQPLGHTAYRNAWNRAIRNAGTPHFVLHSLRHLGLSLFSTLGASEAETMRYGGHKDSKVAVKYQHLLRTRETEMAAALTSRWETEL